MVSGRRGSGGWVLGAAGFAEVPPLSYSRLAEEGME